MPIFSRRTLDAIPWPPGDPGRALLTALIAEGPAPFLANVRAEVGAIAAGGFVLPLVRVDEEPQRPNAYVCSPTTHYVDYAKQEVALELGDQPLLRRTLPPVLEALRPLLRHAQAERIVYVNNWLLSTNLYPALDRAALATIKAELLAAYPDHSIVFRSLNEGLNGAIIAGLEGLGFRRVFSRQVYLLDPRDGAYRRRNNYGHDRRLARRSPYSWVEAAAIPLSASGRLCELYSDLYLEKYSRHNPQLTPYYLARALGERWLNIGALTAGGRIDGVLGTIEQHGQLTAPLVGYDRSRDEALGLYRLLMLRLTEEAAERGRVLHLSSGAASFKRLRGAASFPEYSLIYHAHLAPRRRLPWQLLEWLSRRAIVPLMARFGL